MNLTEILALEANGHASEETRAIRVRHGLYGMREQPGCYLVRLRLPAGVVTSDQLEAVAALAEMFGRPSRVHITTRQGLELYGVEAGQVGEMLGRLARAGLTTRNSGGNVVRGVVACARAGAEPGEPFDVTPWALTADRFLQDHPAFQQLPRKIKIAFEGCAEDHVHTAVSDIGLRAAVRDGRRGFRITIGGGLGASPRLGVPLEPFTPVEELLTTLTAILQVFDAHGNRAVRARARLKWLLQDWGADRLCTAILEARRGLAVPTPPPAELGTPQATETVGVHVPLGDLTPAELRTLAGLARRFACGIRLTIDQNVLLRDLSAADAPRVREALAQAGFRPDEDGRLPDITRCAGRGSCTRAITDSRAAAAAIAEALEPDLARQPGLAGRRIRISGCPNACGHHAMADLGLHGVAHRVGDRMAPCYALLLGGGAPDHPLAERVAEIPARRIGPAVRRVLSDFLAERRASEPFGQFVRRQPPGHWAARLADFATLPDEDRYRDLGATEPFAVR